MAPTLAMPEVTQIALEQALGQRRVKATLMGIREHKLLARLPGLCSRPHPAGLFCSEERIFVESCGFGAGKTPPAVVGEWHAGFAAPVRLGDRARGRVSD
jgi:hypothetical protein